MHTIRSVSVSIAESRQESRARSELVHLSSANCKRRPVQHVLVAKMNFKKIELQVLHNRNEVGFFCKFAMFTCAPCATACWSTSQCTEQLESSASRGQVEKCYRCQHTLREKHPALQCMLLARKRVHWTDRFPRR